MVGLEWYPCCRLKHNCNTDKNRLIKQSVLVAWPRVSLTNKPPLADLFEISRITYRRYSCPCV